MQPDLSASVLFVTTASNAVGFGHLNRCLALAVYANKCGADVSFLVFGDVLAEAQVNAAGFACVLLEESKMHTVDWVKSDRLQADVVIADLLFPGFFAFAAPSLLFGRLGSLGRLLVAIDALGEDSILAKLPLIDADMVVSPYVNRGIDISEIRWRYLQGSEYALLGVEYTNLPQRRQRAGANRILVSCGGSDSKGYTIQVIFGLEAVTQPLEIRAVVGPMFSAELVANLKRMVARSNHHIVLVTAPSTLLNEMLWCDLAVGANGLTKYELAASATPAILFSIDAHHDMANRPFAARQTSIDLGIGVSPKKIEQETTRLLGNVALRSSMAKCGRMLVDGRGAERLFIEIKKELSCLIKS